MNGSRRSASTPRLKVGGILLAVAISRFASALDGISRGLIRDAEFLRIVEKDLETGQHRNETAKPDYFTTAFFHQPDEFKAELTDGGFPTCDALRDRRTVWNVTLPDIPAERERLLTAIRAIESEPGACWEPAPTSWLLRQARLRPVVE
jgi:hypothetical protein